MAGRSASTMASHAMPPRGSKVSTRVRQAGDALSAREAVRLVDMEDSRFMDGRCPERSGPQSICETGNIVMINLN